LGILTKPIWLKEGTMKEKRKLKRRHLIFYLRLFEQKSDKLLGYLVNINTEGFMMIGDSPMEIGKSYKMKLLVNTETNKDHFMEFNAVSRWCKRSVNSSFYDTGFQMENIGSKEFTDIQDIIDVFGFND
jgi:hypothetical protein